MADDRVREEIHEILDRMGELMDARDLAIVDLFAGTDDIMLVGSEPGEIMRGRAAIGGLFASIFDTGARVHWEWETVDISSDTGVGWLFADGSVVIRRDGAETVQPYRLSAVLVREDAGWRLQLFHGSEPKVA